MVWGSFPQVNRAMLYLQKLKGELEVSNLARYHQVAQLAELTVIHNINHHFGSP